MLKIPAFRSFSEQRVTAYQDDVEFWKFYLIPDHVTIRRDDQGKPVFLLVKYAFGDDDRAADPTLPKGGGYLVLDTELRVDPAVQAAVVTQLQTDVDQTWQRLKALADAGGQPVQSARLSVWHSLPHLTTELSIGVDDVLLGLHPDTPGAPPGDAPPKVVLAEPTWTTGTFTLTAPQSKALVSNRIATGPVSMVGANVCSANLDLTSAGATFMEKTLVNPDGTGGAALTPIQVLYNLKFWARVPPVDMRITADSRSLFMSIQQLSHNYAGNGCDDDSISHSESQLQMAVDSGLIEVKLDAGTLPVDDDFLQQVRSMGLKVVQDMIKDKFFDKLPAPPPKDDEEDFSDEDRDIYVMKSNFEQSSMHIEYHEKIETIAEWPIAPQGTLQSFLVGLSPDEVKEFVRTVDLDDDFFKSLGLRVEAFADWDADPVAFIECQVHYTGADENGVEVEKDESFTLTKAAPVGLWDPSLIGSKREYDYRWRVGYLGHEPSEWVDWESSTSPTLNLAIGHPGRVQLDVLAGNVDFATTTKRVQVELQYADPGNQVEPFGTVVELNPAVATQTFGRWIFVPRDEPVRYRTTFFLKNDQQIDGEWQTTTDDRVLINEPRSANRLDVQLVPTGRWDDVVQSVVNLTYTDPLNDIVADSAPYILKSPDTFSTWAVFVANTNLRTYRYRVVTSYKDGSFEDSGWKDGEGDGSLPIAVRTPRKLDVTVLPALVDFSVTPIVEAHLTYDDPANNVHETDTLAITTPEPLMWSVPIKDHHQRRFSCQLTYHPAHGDADPKPPFTSQDDVVVVERLLVRQLELLVVPKVVDFVQTPVVQVAVSYTDAGLDEGDVLVFTDATPQGFKLTLPEGAPRRYTLTVTYFLADGTTDTRPPVTLEQNKVVLPRYVAK